MKLRMIFCSILKTKRGKNIKLYRSIDGTYTHPLWSIWGDVLAFSPKDIKNVLNLAKVDGGRPSQMKCEMRKNRKDGEIVRTQDLVER